MLLGAAGLGVLLALHDVSGVWFAFMGLFVYQGATAAVLQGTVDQRIQRLTVADVMDTEPVTIPAETGLLDAQEEFFLRYRWPWFAVVDPTRHFLGVVRSERVDAEIAAGRPALPVRGRAGGEPAGPHRRRTSRWSRCCAPKGWAASARWWPSTTTACCAAS